MIIGILTDKSLSESWSVTRFELLHKSPAEGHMWVQGRLTQKQVTVRPTHLWPEEWSSMSKNTQRTATNKWAEEKPNLDAARESNKACTPVRTILPDQEEIMHNATRTLEVRRASAMPCEVTKPS